MRSANAAPPSRNLFVANLSRRVGKDDLKHLFSKYGDVEGVTVWIDFKTGKSKGFAIVTLASQKQADRAKAALHLKFWRSRHITIKYARKID